jgi:hypothetical protein
LTGSSGTLTTIGDRPFNSLTFSYIIRADKEGADDRRFYAAECSFDPVDVPGFVG